MTQPSHTIDVRFTANRSIEGHDIASVIRETWPGADIRAEFDYSGAVASYVVVLAFEDSDKAADAAFQIRDFCNDNGWPVEVG